MTTPTEWLEESASVWCSGEKCQPPTLLRSWTGAGYVLRRCAWCRQKGICPDCRTGHDNGTCSAEAVA